MPAIDLRCGTGQRAALELLRVELNADAGEAERSLCRPGTQAQSRASRARQKL
jgi:hypothetical protein